MKFDALLRAHEFMIVERPPVLWEGQTDLERFVPLLGEMIAAGLTGGAELGALTLNASNVVVAAGDDEGSGPEPGEYLAITVSGRTNLGPDDRWTPAQAASGPLLRRLDDPLRYAAIRFAYVRHRPPEGSVTVFVARGDGETD